ncbi:MAG: hypothetical protein HRT35_14115, partial [Algicola sp.]|nr:hypothetical protein [Algicola sp.]
MKCFNAKNVAVLVLLSIVMTGCKSTGQQSGKGKEESKVQISLDIDSENGAFWMIYGLATSACSSDYPFYSFGEFYCAFSMANTVNTTPSKNIEKPVTTFAHDLAKIAAAGYFKEYAYHYYRQSQWFAEPGLKTAAFEQWMATELPNHPKGQMGASVSGRSERDKATGKPVSVQLDSAFMKASGPVSFSHQTNLDDPSQGIRLRYL